jgi:hypothetical protein
VYVWNNDKDTAILRVVLLRGAVEAQIERNVTPSAPPPSGCLRSGSVLHTGSYAEARTCS